jgi:hypothetical protein
MQDLSPRITRYEDACMIRRDGVLVNPEWMVSCGTQGLGVVVHDGIPLAGV